MENGCLAKGLCGLPGTFGKTQGLGGGWEICLLGYLLACCINPTASNFDHAATIGDNSCVGGAPFRMGVKWEIWGVEGTGGCTDTGQLQSFGNTQCQRWEHWNCSSFGTATATALRISCRMELDHLISSPEYIADEPSSSGILMPHDLLELSVGDGGQLTAWFLAP